MADPDLLLAAVRACEGLAAVPLRVVALLPPEEHADFIANPRQAREFVQTLVACGEPGINDPVVVGHTECGVEVRSDGREKLVSRHRSGRVGGRIHGTGRNK